MATNWPEIAFSDVLVGSTRNGIYKKKEFHGSGVKIVNMGELFANTRLFSVPMKRVELTEKEKAKSCLQRSDLLFARRSLVAEGAGKCSIVMEIDEPTTFESSIIRGRPDPKQVDSLFLYYLFNSPHGIYLLGTILRHVAVAGITGSDLVQLKIPRPPLPEQRAIAHILGSLDDKIELNRRMNKTMEAMARAIFKSWFVDFDPVRAKAEGRDPGLPDEIAALFPDSFQDSDLGEIPKGWEIKPLDDIALLKTQTIQPKNFTDKIWEHYSIPAFDKGRQPVCDAGKDIKSGKYAVPENCVLASKLNPQFPRVWLPDVQDADSAICSTEFMPFVPNIKSYRPFLYEMLQSHPVQSEISSRVTGSTGSRQRVKPKEIAVMPCLVPPKDVVDTFCDQVGPLHDNQLSNIRQSAILSSLRDTLLPKLISGELRVPDAEKLVEGAV